MLRDYYFNDFALRPYRSSEKLKASSAWTKALSPLPRKPCQQGLRPCPQTERVGDVIPLFDEINRRVYPRYKFQLGHLKRDNFFQNRKIQFNKEKVAETNRRLQQELVLVHKRFQNEMRLHMGRDLIHDRVPCGCS